MVKPASERPVLRDERDGLQKYFRQDDGRSAIEIHAAFHLRDIRHEVAEVAQAAFAERRAGRARVHVDDVGADRHMDRQRNLAVSQLRR